VIGSVEEILAGSEALRPGLEAFYKEPQFRPTKQSTTRTGIEALGAAALAWLAKRPQRKEAQRHGWARSDLHCAAHSWVQRRWTVSTELAPEEVVRKFFECYTNGRPEDFDEVVAPDYVDYGHTPTGTRARWCS
jgi:hypothetical protein